MAVMEMLAHAHVLVNVSSTALVCIVDLVDLTYMSIGMERMRRNYCCSVLS